MNTLSLSNGKSRPSATAASPSTPHLPSSPFTVPQLLKARLRAAGNESVYSDRWSGRFERVIGIDAGVDASQIRAKLKNGVLAVTLPKSADRLPRRIEIQ